MKQILVAGGAGYIGSGMVRRLLEEKYKVVVLDNLSTGHRSLVPEEAVFVNGDLMSPLDCRNVFKKFKIEAVMHFAASALVGESVKNPIKYYENNVAACVNLLKAMSEARVKNFIFSSTCAVYGEPVEMPIKETHPTNPANPYGRSKLAIEWMLRDVAATGALSFIALRYFNACGAHHSKETGEMHDPETHLIPNVLKAALGRKKELVIFGDDYDTPDGTCIRDYIHVEDIAQAHLLALRALKKGVKNQFINLGIGRGFSNLEIVKKARKITGRPIPYKIGPRRPGDPSRLIANALKARKLLGWVPKLGLEEIIRSAWNWERRAAARPGR